MRGMSVAMLGTALALAGCKTVNTAGRQTPMGTPDPVLLNKVETDSTVSRIAQIVAINQGTVSGDLLRVDAEISNTSSRYQQCIYRFEWKDLNGLAVQTPTSIWIPLQLEGKESKTITGIAPTPQAKDFRLKLMESKR